MKMMAPPARTKKRNLPKQSLPSYQLITRIAILLMKKAMMAKKLERKNPL